jgi:hypothetical protein
MANQSSKGQGWHGDSEGHRRAGRKGGLARARNRKAAAGQRS